MGPSAFVSPEVVDFMCGAVNIASVQIHFGRNNHLADCVCHTEACRCTQNIVNVYSMHKLSTMSTIPVKTCQEMAQEARSA